LIEGVNDEDDNDSDGENDKTIPESRNNPVNTRKIVPRRSPRLIEKEKKALAEEITLAKLALTEVKKISHSYAAAANDKALSFKEIWNSPRRMDFIEAIRSEFASIEKNQVWELVLIAPERKLLQTKWIFNTKRDAFGIEIRKKGRSVIIGCMAKLGVDYTETYAPVTKLPSLRIFLSIVNQFRMFMFQLDVDTAFLYAPLLEEIFIEIPEMFSYYFRVNTNGKCLRLKKALYGLPQSPRAWFFTIDGLLKELGYEPLIHEPCLYIRKENSGVTSILTLYVDDIIIAHTNQGELFRIVALVEARFGIKRIGEPKKMLGIQIEHSRENGTLCISVKDKIIKLLDEFKISEVKRVPMDPTAKLRSCEESDLEEEKKTIYRSLLGKLMFIMVAARPDISYAVSSLASFMTNPCSVHLELVFDILKYLKGTVNLAIQFKRVSLSDYTLMAYSDSDWGGNLDNRRSRSGGIITLANTPIYWSSNVQTLVALSSAEAELNALKEIVKSVLWIRGILKDTIIAEDVVSKPTVVFEDNRAALEIATNPEVSKRNRHYDMTYHFIRENVGEFKQFNWFGLHRKTTLPISSPKPYQLNNFCS
jgi:hypothetical protein